MASTEAHRQDAIIAEWNDGVALRSEYLDWLDAQDLEDTPDAVFEYVFVRSLAAQAEASLDPEGERRLRLDVQRRRQDLLVPRLRRHMATGVEIDEAELEQLRLEHPDAFRRPKKVQLRNIYKEAPSPGDAERVHTEMLEILERLRLGADFEETARAISESQTRFRGGRLGLVDPSELPEDLAEVVEGLTPGQFSEPVRTGNGWTIFWCEDIREGTRPTPEEVRAKLRVNLERKRARELWSQQLESAQSDVEIDLGAQDEVDGAGRLASSTDIVLRVGELTLERGDLDALTEQFTRHREDVDDTELHSHLEAWGVRAELTRRALELGLGNDPDVAASLRWIRTEELARRELVRQIDQVVEMPSEEELRTWFEARSARYRELQSFELGALRFGDEIDPRFADQVVQNLRSGTLAFEDAARKYSAGSSPNGYLGWTPFVRLLRWGPIASRAIRDLERGETSELLRTESGFWVFRLLDRREPRVPELEGIRPRVLADWRRAEIEAKEQSFRRQHLESIGAARVDPARVVEPKPVVLTWKMASEHEVFGFHVYRSRTPDGPFERVTPEALPAAGTTDMPTQYRFEDPHASIGGVYYYYVESVSTHGVRTQLTPVRKVVAKAQTVEDDPPSTARSRTD